MYKVRMRSHLYQQTIQASHHMLQQHSGTRQPIHLASCTCVCALVKTFTVKFTAIFTLFFFHSSYACQWNFGLQAVILWEYLYVSAKMVIFQSLIRCQDISMELRPKTGNVDYPLYPPLRLCQAQMRDVRQTARRPFCVSAEGAALKQLASDVMITSNKRSHCFGVCWLPHSGSSRPWKG